MKARDLRDRSTEDLAELEKSLTAESFQNRFKNFTNRLDDTSVINKSKRDLARVKLILAERARGITVVYKAADVTPQKPKTRPPKPPKQAEVETAEAESAEGEKEAPAKKKASKPAVKAAPAAKTKAKAESAEKPAAKKPKAKTEKSK